MIKHIVFLIPYAMKRDMPISIGYVTCIIASTKNIKNCCFFTTCNYSIMNSTTMLTVKQTQKDISTKHVNEMQEAMLIMPASSTTI